MTAELQDARVVVTCNIQTKLVTITAHGHVIADALWAESAMRGLIWRRPATRDEQALVKLAEEKLVAAWRDADVRRASYTHAAEAVALGIRPDASLPDHGELGRELGDLLEHQTLGVVRAAIAEQPWAKGARRATPDEDAEGKDIIIETDRGELYVQVKASAKTVADWRRKHGESLGARAIIVVCNNGRPPPTSAIAQQIWQAYRIMPIPTTLSRNEIDELIVSLPRPLHCLFDATKTPLVARNVAYLETLNEAYRLSLAREQERTERMRLFEAGRKETMRSALRIAVRALKDIDQKDALAEIAKLDEHFIGEAFLKGNDRTE